MRVALVVGTIVVAILGTAVIVSVASPAEDAREFRGLAEIAAGLSSATTTTTTTTSTTTTTAPPTTATNTTAPPAGAAPEADQSDPGAPSPEECQAFLNEVLSAGRPPTSGETQYLWLLCGIDIDDHYP